MSSSCQTQRPSSGLNRSSPLAATEVKISRRAKGLPSEMFVSGSANGATSEGATPSARARKAWVSVCSNGATNSVATVCPRSRAAPAMVGTKSSLPLPVPVRTVATVNRCRGAPAARQALEHQQTRRRQPSGDPRAAARRDAPALPAPPAAWRSNRSADSGARWCRRQPGVDESRGLLPAPGTSR